MMAWWACPVLGTVLVTRIAVSRRPLRLPLSSLDSAVTPPGAAPTASPLFVGLPLPVGLASPLRAAAGGRRLTVRRPRPALSPARARARTLPDSFPAPLGAGSLHPAGVLARAR